MHVINARNVNHALPLGIDYLMGHGVREESRNGPVLRAPTPVATVYERPMERVLFNQSRDANPFFHIVEAAWMLAGRDDLKYLTPYVSRMYDYSDDGGVTSPGAYGKRWRDWFMDVGDERGNFPNFDQLDWAVRRLKKDPTDRRVVIQMWDASVDPHRADDGSRDVPCNLTALPWVFKGSLNLTVFCRSNDAVWGAYGANAVQFSFLLEYLASRLGLDVGTYTQISNNFHAYVDTLPSGNMWDSYRVYEDLNLSTYPLFKDAGALTDGSRDKIFLEDLKIFFEHGAAEAVIKARWPWVRQVLCPMALAHQAWRKKDDPARFAKAQEILQQVRAEDWKMAGSEWVERRAAAYQRVRDDGVSYE